MALRPLLLVVVVSSAILPASDARFYCISNFLYTLDGGGICTRDANGLVEATGQPGFYCNTISGLSIVSDSDSVTNNTLVGRGGPCMMSLRDWGRGAV